MARLAAGTVVAKNYLPFARVLAGSFRERHPDIPFFVVLADEVDGHFDPAREPFVMLSLRDLNIPQLGRFCFHYSRQSLVVATKSFLLDYLLSQGFSSAIFLDADILILGNLDALFAIVQKHSIVLTPHLLAPLTGPGREARELNILLSGTYNGGFIGVSESASARAFLSWWQDRLYEHCHHAVAGGMHYDQHWLDLVPVYFEDVHILRDPTYNVAYWGLPERNAQVPENLSPADIQPCRFFHFSGFDPEQPPAVTRYSPRLTMGNVGPAVFLFDHYAKLLNAAGYPEAKSWPYAYNYFDNGLRIPRVARHLFQNLGNARARFGDPRRAGGSDSFFNWLNEPIDSSADLSLTITQLWHGIHRLRVDVQRAFPDLLGTNRRDFIEWAMAFGVHEMNISESFVPSDWNVARPT
jgi:hypothetical protein